MTHVATEVFLAENDGLLGATGMNNFFLYRAKDTKQHRFLPWDKDSSFLLPDFSIFERTNDNVLFRRAFAYPDLREVYLQALEAAARSAAEEDWLETEITRAAELISATVEEDNRKQFSTEEFVAQVDWLKAVCAPAVEVRVGAGGRRPSGADEACTWGENPTITVKNCQRRRVVWSS